MGRVFGDLRGRDRIVQQRTRPRLLKRLVRCKWRGYDTLRPAPAMAKFIRSWSRSFVDVVGQAAVSKPFQLAML
jgi:hypothetical protein